MLSSLAVMGLLGVVLGAPPAVSNLDATRQGDDMTLAWSAVAGADTYRVYGASTPDCQPSDLLWEGPQTSWTDPGAFLDPGAYLYRIAAVGGGAEGPPSAPAYKYEHDVWVSATSGSVPIPIPFHVPAATAEELCQMLALSNARIDTVARFRPESATFGTHVCGSGGLGFSLVPGETVFLGTRTDGVVSLWGHGHPVWQHELPLGSTPWTSIGTYILSLPWDHGYQDLYDIGADVADSIEVAAYDRALERFVGIQRLDPASPWTGTNVVVSGLRPFSLLIKVAAPTSWIPRRQCEGGGCIVPPRMDTLRLARDGSDVSLRWTSLPSASGGYAVYRVEQVGDLSGLPQPLPFLETPDPQPAFPLVDAGAAGPGAPPLLFYQAAGRCSDGTIGSL